MLRIIDETDNYLVVDKPYNLNFHSENNEIGFFSQLEKEKNQKLYPINRLDKATSGLIIVAKNLKTARDINELFASRQVEKYYIALSDKSPKKKQGTVKGDMTKSRNGNWKLTRTHTNPAITKFFSYGSQNGTRLFILKIETGKTHQIRVAMKSLGAPIIGDERYHSKEHKIETVDRMYLHSYALKFELYDRLHSYLLVPKTGELWQDFNAWQGAIHIFSPDKLNWPKGK